MTLTRAAPVSLALRDPHALAGWTLPQWEALVRQARSANLLSRLAALLEDQGLLEQVPVAPRAHLEAACVISQAQEEAVRREVANICKALARTGADIVLLKGAAYLFAGLPAARGRVFSDIDILVPSVALAEVEAAGEPQLRLLAPADMVLHSAAHLFLNEDLGSGLRDLADLDSLLRHFGRKAGFWHDLTARAGELELARPLYYALRYSKQILRHRSASAAGRRCRPAAGVAAPVDGRPVSAGAAAGARRRAAHAACPALALRSRALATHAAPAPCNPPDNQGVLRQTGPCGLAPRSHCRGSCATATLGSIPLGGPRCARTS